ncbi:hypothetical protein [uncultured Aeromicrobium sp.]|uniref:hypothetical protein n=1 Tax=uncultured Aeromicrobium sp. TaxID=337820 RepID=UPI0025CEA331|nr:hypothetical protein [uncultured Aeromicrobium sp.]
MNEYKTFRASDQRILAQQIADDLNDGITRERHAEIAAAVLTSDWLAAHGEQVRAEQREIDLAMHQAYRPEVVAEVAVYLGDDADWDGIARWCGGDIETGRDISDEYYSWIVIPGFGQVHQGQWLMKHHDGSWSVRTEVEGPSAQSLESIRAEAKAEALTEFADSTRFPHDWVLFRRDDGSGVTISDLLRETAARYRRIARGEAS